MDRADATFDGITVSSFDADAEHAHASMARPSAVAPVEYRQHEEEEQEEVEKLLHPRSSALPACALDDDHYYREFYEFKQRVKNKRKSTFCGIFSIGTLILSVILILAPLSTQMLTDWKLYQHSSRTQCEIVNITYMNGTQFQRASNQSSTQTSTAESATCVYHFRTTDGHNLSRTCLNAMHEEQACHIGSGEEYHIGDVNECYFYNEHTCKGAMIGVLMLQRNNSMFVILLGLGSLFAISTLFTTLYAVRMIHAAGIYCSVVSIQNDDDKAYELMAKFREHVLKQKGLPSPRSQNDSKAIHSSRSDESKSSTLIHSAYSIQMASSSGSVPSRCSQSTSPSMH
eukprot:CAMPEP_0197028460 /NCGR_PEP_ID=MMETSP1384-20130603/8138_1 /TAXON_ID=29189 /ORGANISM="Ammonia sp." /LENGTH=342 /DNA_ID=CAMNT_0042457465 /DNA_START=191 /DNA_END=1219 /DNA_ORIENTATION=-